MSEVILTDANFTEEVLHFKGVVLVEKVGSTLYTEIAQELELLQRQEIKVLGGIVVEQYLNDVQQGMAVN